MNLWPIIIEMKQWPITGFHTTTNTFCCRKINHSECLPGLRPRCFIHRTCSLRCIVWTWISWPPPPGEWTWVCPYGQRTSAVAIWRGVRGASSSLLWPLAFRQQNSSPVNCSLTEERPTGFKLYRWFSVYIWTVCLLFIKMFIYVSLL